MIRWPSIDQHVSLSLSLHLVFLLFPHLPLIPPLILMLFPDPHQGYPCPHSVTTFSLTCCIHTPWRTRANSDVQASPCIELAILFPVFFGAEESCHCARLTLYFTFAYLQCIPPRSRKYSMFLAPSAHILLPFSGLLRFYVAPLAPMYPIISHPSSQVHT
jgi:hypothetical protein